MEGQFENKKVLTLTDAMAELAALEQQMQMGPFDSERDSVENIRRQLLQGELLPVEAIDQARKLEAARSSQYR